MRRGEVGPLSRKGNAEEGGLDLLEIVGCWLSAAPQSLSPVIGGKIGTIPQGGPRGFTQ